MITLTDLLALAPLLATAAAALVVTLVVSLHRHHGIALGTTLLGLATAMAMLPWTAGTVPRTIPPLLVVDRYSLFFTGLLLATAFAVALLAHGYLARRDEQREEFYILLLIATLGCLVLVSSAHFVSFFLGLEILSVGLYGLVGYFRQESASVEAGLKYLVLAGASSAFLLFGMALVYADLGTLEFARMADTPGGGVGLLTLGGLALLVTGVGFKLALVPFHLWTPDVYQGAPAPATAFLATASKGAMFALLLRYFLTAGAASYGAVHTAFAVVAVASMLVGNLLALLEDNVKRILAYSSIAHLGYLLVGFLAGSRIGVEAVLFYLAAYVATTLAAFGVVTVLSGREGEAERLEDYRGLYWRRPALACVFTAALLSLAGIPLTGGFLAKFYLLAAGVGSSLWVLALVLVATSAVGLFYYLRVVVAMFSAAPVEGEGEDEAEGGRAPALAPLPRAGGAALAVLALVVLWLGTWPAPLLRLIEAAAGVATGG